MVHGTSLSGTRSDGLVAICFYVIGLEGVMTETIVAQDRYLDRFCVRMVAERIPGKAF